MITSHFSDWGESFGERGNNKIRQKRAFPLGGDTRPLPYGFPQTPASLSPLPLCPLFFSPNLPDYYHACCGQSFGDSVYNETIDDRRSWERKCGYWYIVYLLSARYFKISLVTSVSPIPWLSHFMPSRASIDLRFIERCGAIRTARDNREH